MIDPSTQPISMTSFLLNLLIVVLAFYSAWTNFSRKKITSFSLDALAVFLAGLIIKKPTEVLRKDSNLIKRSGIVMILLGLSALRLVISYLVQK
jgi:hypothetical protein